MTFSISRASVDDVDRVAPLFAAYRQFYRAVADPQSETSFIESRLSAGDSVIFVAAESESNDPAGFTQLYPLFSSVRMRPIWILNDLFVSEKYRGNSVGSLLMQQAEDFARESGAAGIELATELTNEPAQRLYEKRGWTRDTEFYHYALNF